MSAARRLALVLTLLVGASAARAVETVPPQLAPWLDTSADQVLERVYVPSPDRRVGEVRILRRGVATVVQTLLYSKVLSQVVGEIRKKERASWTDDPDSLRYVETLERAQKTIFARLPTNARVADRRQKLWIDFVVAPQAAFVAIGAFEMEERGEEVRVVRREVLALPELSRRYVERNQRLIVADSFHVEGAALAKLLGPAPGE